MKDNEGKIIYIGKAKNLHRRVGSYFVRQSKGDSRLNWKTSQLVSKISDIEYMATDNEIEALLLESNLIKRYRPIFNIELKDQQRYTYLKITDEIFPRLVVARRNRDGKFLGPKGYVYGPFVRGSSKFLTVGLLRKLFKVRICDRLPCKPCLEYHIKNCDAPCINNVTQEQYTYNINRLKEILEGKDSIEKFINELEIQMKEASYLQNYEKAREIRDTLFRLNNLRIKQKMERTIDSNYDEDYIGILYNANRAAAYVLILKQIHGVITDRKKFEFDLVGDNSLSSFILQYYSTVATIPRFIYVNELPDSKDVIEQALERICSHQVNIINMPDISGEKRQIMDLLIRNLQLYSDKGHEPAITELQNLLQLPLVPLIIDCFDISNFGQDFAVGACTRFVNARPFKKGYRKFRIKKVHLQNDFAMIEEIVTRRYSGLQDVPLPDLIVIDGGKGQLHSATKAIEKIGILDIPCIALAKENEEIYRQDMAEPLRLPRNNSALKVLQHIRDEAHRFGLQYNRSLRKFS